MGKDSMVSILKAGRSSLVLWGADCLPHPDGEEISLRASRLGLEAALNDWRHQHRHELARRSSFSMGGGIGIARVPRELAEELARLIETYLKSAFDSLPIQGEI